MPDDRVMAADSGLMITNTPPTATGVVCGSTPKRLSAGRSTENLRVTR